VAHQSLAGCKIGPTKPKELTLPGLILGALITTVFTAANVYLGLKVGVPAVLTLAGWCLLIKGVIRFCAPKQALRVMTRVSVERALEFQVAGAGIVVLAGLLGYGVYAG